MSKQNTNNFSLMDFVDEENDRQMRELEGKVAELTQMVSSSSEINKQIETEKNEAISELKTLKNEFNTLSPKTSFSVSLFKKVRNMSNLFILNINFKLQSVYNTTCIFASSTAVSAFFNRQFWTKIFKHLSAYWPRLIFRISDFTIINKFQGQNRRIRSFDSYQTAVIFKKNLGNRLMSHTCTRMVKKVSWTF